MIGIIVQFMMHSRRVGKKEKNFSEQVKEQILWSLRWKRCVIFWMTMKTTICKIRVKNLQNESLLVDFLSIILYNVRRMNYNKERKR